MTCSRTSCEYMSTMDDNFCPTVEEYASVGVDVSDWYAAQE